jgi:hypothetical protein
MHKVAIIIPFYRKTLLEYEKIALDQCEKVLSGYPKIAIKPESLALPGAAKKYKFSNVISFKDKYFEGIKGYNTLLLSELFYSKFLDYEYILIHQLDAFVFKDELNYWCNQGYDYIGAPWVRNKIYPHIFKELTSRALFYIHTRFDITKNGLPSKKQFDNKVGNGGFSLRRVGKFHALSINLRSKTLKYLSHDEHEFNEDVFWSIEVNRKKKNLKIPSHKVGLKFSIEIFPYRALQINNNQLPFGCHDWDKYPDFWRPIFEKYGYNI